MGVKYSTPPQCIFHADAYDHAFLATLAEAHERFGFVMHRYGLMGNHDHLFLHTPRGNLGRAMRPINGVYTQRDNRLKHTDGPLFRGRYQAILVVYMSQQLGGYRLAEIMRPVGRSNIGSVSFITTQIRKRSKESQEFSQAIQYVKQHFIQHAF